MNDLIPELLKSLAATVARNALTPIITVLVAQGWIVESDGQKLIVIAGVVLAAVAWGVWQKIQASKTLNIALALPEGATMADVQKVRDIEANGGGRRFLLLITLALIVPFSACGKPEQLARGAAQAYVGLNGIADGVALMARNGEVGADDARRAFAGLQKVALTAEVFSNRAQSGGYSKSATLDAANKLLADVRELQSQGLFANSEAARVRWNLIFFAAETGINTAKIVIAKRGETKAEARRAAVAAGDALRQQITARAASRGIGPAALTELIALGQRVTVDLVTVSLMAESEAWAYRAELAGALKTKLSQ